MSDLWELSFDDEELASVLESVEMIDPIIDFTYIVDAETLPKDSEEEIEPYNPLRPSINATSYQAESSADQYTPTQISDGFLEVMKCNKVYFTLAENFPDIPYNPYRPGLNEGISRW